MIETTNKYPRLPRSYKGFYPFKLSTTSFIYPDDYIANVSLLGHYFDEIELLLFESRDIESLFPRSIVHELNRLAKDLSIGYNVHLPTDISISAPDACLQQHAVESYKKTIELILPLNPSTFILHVPFGEEDTKKAAVEKWRTRVRSNLNRLLDGRIEGSLISIETLDYPLDFIQDIVEELDLTICIDLGHLIIGGYNMMEIFKRYASKISSIHLHGVENNQDHLAIDRLAQQYIQPIFEILKHFKGILSVEVFSYRYLNRSLPVLERWWNKFNASGI